MIKKVIKAVMPSRLLMYRRKLITLKGLRNAYDYDFQRYYEFSRTKGSNSSEKLIGEIITIYHVIEKGLTMPDPRLGFGQERMEQLCSLCLKYMDDYGQDNEQLKHAIQVILEYEDFHMCAGFQLVNSVNDSIQKVRTKSKGAVACSQREITKSEYFKHRNGDFLHFSNSRASVRNFSDENIPIEKMLEAIELARNTPSACNRQSWRTYVYTNKNQIAKILKVQGGNRGFGHLANKLIVLAGEIGVFNGIAERNQAFIDGGMYGMNLLYALHYYGIGACILNCSHWPEKDMEIRRLCGIKDSEVFVAMIVCGAPPVARYKLAASKRYSLAQTNMIVD